jgi:hypothetical protein
METLNTKVINIQGSALSIIDIVPACHRKRVETWEILPTMTLRAIPDAIGTIVSATVDRLRQRNLTCSQSTQHECCLPALLNGAAQSNSQR